MAAKRFPVEAGHIRWPGDHLAAAATVEALREEGGQQLVDLAIRTRNQNGEEVLRANATARIDP